MLTRKPGPILFALVCVAMAAADYRHPLDGKFIGLILLATVPWLAPGLVPLISSLKVGGLELKFRKLEEKAELAQATAIAAAAGVGKTRPGRRRVPTVEAQEAVAGAGYVSHSVPKAPPPGAAEPPADDASDPNKGQFGGHPERDGFRLDAQVTAVPQSTELFLVHAWVESTDPRRPLRDGAPVTFHLHPTFADPVVTVLTAGAQAAIDRLAWGAFTIGVEVENTRLELDLATEVEAPRLFCAR